jgi:hypothetical protein
MDSVIVVPVSDEGMIASLWSKGMLRRLWIEQKPTSIWPYERFSRTGDSLVPRA